MQAVAHFVETFVPEHYDVFLDLSRKTKTFSGRVVITGQAKADKISLHQKDLTIETVEVAGQARPFTVDDANEAVYVELEEAGHVTVTLTYTGKITDNMTGIYPSYYSIDGVKKEVISTQFESHFAREAFPSVDEPEAKATFDLSLKFDQEEGEVALSNMPEICYDSTDVFLSPCLCCWGSSRCDCQNKKWYSRRYLLNQGPSFEKLRIFIGYCRSCHRIL